MKFDNEADYAEWIATTHGIIEAFKARGYALYVIGAADSVAFMGPDLLNNVISFGPTEDVLELGLRYIPLPLVNKEQRDNPAAVMAAVNQMIFNIRGPFFLDLQTMDDGNIEARGAHLIDSIFIEPPFLYMVIDSRFGSGKEGSIELHLSEAAHKISRQVQLALRDDSMSTGHGTVN